jgi:predicted DNA-binding transcriptional regulator AlpA
MGLPNTTEQFKSSRIVSFDCALGKDRILRVGSLRARFDPPVGRATIYRWIKQGDFPAAFYINGRPYWRESDIDAFIASRMPGVRNQEIAAASV